MATVFTFLFAFACLATFVFGVREQWKTARMTSAVVAIVLFLMALLSVRVK